MAGTCGCGERDWGGGRGGREIERERGERERESVRTHGHADTWALSSVIPENDLCWFCTNHCSKVLLCILSEPHWAGQDHDYHLSLPS